jgi:hypothetical protein
MDFDMASSSSKGRYADGRDRGFVAAVRLPAFDGVDFERQFRRVPIVKAYVNGRKPNR